MIAQLLIGTFTIVIGLLHLVGKKSKIYKSDISTKNLKKYGEGIGIAFITLGIIIYFMAAVERYNLIGGFKYIICYFILALIPFAIILFYKKRYYR